MGIITTATFISLQLSRHTSHKYVLNTGRFAFTRLRLYSSQCVDGNTSPHTETTPDITEATSDIRSFLARSPQALRLERVTTSSKAIHPRLSRLLQDCQCLIDSPESLSDLTDLEISSLISLFASLSLLQSNATFPKRLLAEAIVNNDREPHTFSLSAPVYELHPFAASMRSTSREAYWDIARCLMDHKTKTRTPCRSDVFWRMVIHLVAHTREDVSALDHARLCLNTLVNEPHEENVVIYRIWIMALLHPISLPSRDRASEALNLFRTHLLTFSNDPHIMVWFWRAIRMAGEDPVFDAKELMQALRPKLHFPTMASHSDDHIPPAIDNLGKTVRSIHSLLRLATIGVSHPDHNVEMIQWAQREAKDAHSRSGLVDLAWRRLVLLAWGHLSRSPDTSRVTSSASLNVILGRFWQNLPEFKSTTRLDVIGSLVAVVESLRATKTKGKRNAPSDTHSRLIVGECWMRWTFLLEHPFSDNIPPPQVDETILVTFIRVSAMMRDDTILPFVRDHVRRLMDSSSSAIRFDPLDLAVELTVARFVCSPASADDAFMSVGSDVWSRVPRELAADTGLHLSPSDMTPFVERVIMRWCAIAFDQDDSEGSSVLLRTLLDGAFDSKDISISPKVVFDSALVLVENGRPDLATRALLHLPAFERWRLLDSIVVALPAEKLVAGDAIALGRSILYTLHSQFHHNVILSKAKAGHGSPFFEDPTHLARMSDPYFPIDILAHHIEKLLLVLLKSGTKTVDLVVAILAKFVPRVDTVLDDHESISYVAGIMRLMCRSLHYRAARRLVEVFPHGHPFRIRLGLVLFNHLVHDRRSTTLRSHLLERVWQDLLTQPGFSPRTSNILRKTGQLPAVLSQANKVVGRDTSSRESATAIQYNLRLGKFSRAAEIFRRTRKTGGSTSSYNSFLNAAFHHADVKNARQIKDLFSLYHALVSGDVEKSRGLLDREPGATLEPFVPDRITANIMMKSLIRWPRIVDAKKLQDMFDMFVHAGYPGVSFRHAAEDKPDHPSSSLPLLKITGLSPKISFQNHTKPLYKAFIKGFHMRGDQFSARMVLGILKEAEAAQTADRRTEDTGSDPSGRSHV